MSIGGESEVIIGSLPAPDGAEMLRFGEIALAESLSSLQPETSSDTAEPALAIMTVEEVYFAGMTPEERPIGYEMMEEDCTRWLTVLGLAEWIGKFFKDGTPMVRFVEKCQYSMPDLFKLDKAVGPERETLIIKMKGFLMAHLSDDRIEK